MDLINDTVWWHWIFIVPVAALFLLCMFGAIMDVYDWMDTRSMWPLRLHRLVDISWSPKVSYKGRSPQDAGHYYAPYIPTGVGNEKP